MREINNIEHDSAALQALSEEIADFCLHTRYLLIPSPERLTDAVILLRRLILISHKVLPIKSYFNLLRNLQRIVMTSHVLSLQETEAMPEDTAAKQKAKEDAYERFDSQFRASLAVHPAGAIEGERVAAMVRHQLCTEDVFCAACAFLQLEVSRRGSIYYIRGESPDFSETKKNRDPLTMDNEMTLKTLASNLARPDLERGAVEQTQITYGFNLMAKLYQLFSMMPVVLQWIKDGEHLANPRRKVDVRAHFNLTLRDYDTMMVMARQMGMTTLKSRKESSGYKWALNAKIEERVMAHAKTTGFSPNRALNALLYDFFMVIDARKRGKALKAPEAAVDASTESSKAADAPQARVKGVKSTSKTVKETPNGETGAKQRT